MIFTYKEIYRQMDTKNFNDPFNTAVFHFLIQKLILHSKKSTDKWGQPGVQLQFLILVLACGTSRAQKITYQWTQANKIIILLLPNISMVFTRMALVQ